MQIKDKQINPVINITQDVLDNDIDRYLELKNNKKMKKTIQEKALLEAEEQLNRSLLILLSVLPETNDVSYSGNLQTPTINLSETLSVTPYDDTYYFVRQNAETKEVDYYESFTSGDLMYESIKREMNIIYPETRQLQKESQKTFKIE